MKVELVLYSGTLGQPTDSMNMLNREVIEIDDNESIENNKEIKYFEFLKKCGFKFVKPYISRCILLEPGKRFDVDFGSWSKFVMVRKLDQ